MKICRICGELKELNEFHKKKDSKDGTRNECKECCKNIQKKYRKMQGYKEKRKEYDRKRYLEKREEILEYKKEYHRNNYKSKIKTYRQDNLDKYANIQANYRKNNPHYIAWRSLIHRVIKQFGTEKENHTIDELGYSASDLKEHMESLFKEGMDWNNWGVWHIDHIKSVSSFDKNTPISVVNALSNLQPLWSNENLSKGKY